MAIISNRPSALGQGIGALSQILSQYTQEKEKRNKDNILKDLLSQSDPRSMNQRPQESFEESQSEEVIGPDGQTILKETMASDQMGQPRNQKTQAQRERSDGNILEISRRDPQLGATLQRQRDSNRMQDQYQDKELNKKELAILKMNEPKIDQTNSRLEKAESSLMGYERMEKILAESGDKFPSRFTASMLDLEGDSITSKIGKSLILSAPAQEFTKLVVNKLTDAKDTFGARLTDFDVNKFLQGLPSLLNSPEGRDRIIRQLKTMDEINILYNQGILDEIDLAGGADKIPYSTAVKRTKKKMGSRKKELKEKFVNPDGNDNTLSARRMIKKSGTTKMDGYEFGIDKDGKKGQISSEEIDEFVAGGGTVLWDN